jgi:hypothetical protein
MTVRTRDGKATRENEIIFLVTFEESCARRNITGKFIRYTKTFGAVTTWRPEVVQAW